MAEHFIKCLNMVVLRNFVLHFIFEDNVTNRVNYLSAFSMRKIERV